LAARAVGIQVKDVRVAFEESVARGARPVVEPTFVSTCRGQRQEGHTYQGCYMAEVELYGDVVLRYLSFDDDPAISASSPSASRTPFLPHLSPIQGKIAERETFGIRRIDHAVGNVPNLLDTLTRVSMFTGFHEFAEFTSEDVGTVESGLNSVVLASDTEHILLPLNEPTEGRYV
jgi:4-hydroxyphenylpyruvate dioxygenase